jgi:hypothetical protein
MADQKVYYKKVRDLGGIFGATFGFIKQNFKPLYSSLLFFAGPFLLIAAAISANMFGTGSGIDKIFKGGIGFFYSEFIISYFITLSVVLIGITIFDVIINKNLIENEKMQSNERLTINHSITNFFSDFWRVFGNTLLLILFFVIFILVIVLVFAGLYALAQGGRGNNSGVLGAFVLLFISLFAVLIIFGPIITFVPMAAIFVCQRDNVPIFAAIRKVLYYLKGNFWNTWAIIFVGALAYAVMSVIVQIPVLILSLISVFSRLKANDSFQDQSTSLFMIVVISVCSLLAYGVRVFFYLIAIYQYTSLEEKKEGASIIDKINQIR